jgi:hypothetical protein
MGVLSSLQLGTLAFNSLVRSSWNTVINAVAPFAFLGAAVAGGLITALVLWPTVQGIKKLTAMDRMARRLTPLNQADLKRRVLYGRGFMTLGTLMLLGLALWAATEFSHQKGFFFLFSPHFILVGVPVFFLGMTCCQATDSLFLSSAEWDRLDHPSPAPLPGAAPMPPVAPIRPTGSVHTNTLGSGSDALMPLGEVQGEPSAVNMDNLPSVGSLQR